MKKFKRVFVSNPNFRFGTNHLLDLADEIVYVCDSPIFDDLLEAPDSYDKFEQSVTDKMWDFRPEADAIAFYGDALIFGIMIWELRDMKLTEDVAIARWSSKANKYLVRKLEI